ncbi:MAG: 50S ribosomal protein L11 methyltransferase [Bacteroidetes bacterium]|nr:50S ribosomal protein L11 methyltransferase [Bacteroidota bacterium]
MSKYIQIHFTKLHCEQKEILIAQLSDIGFDGFEEKENELDAFIPEVNYNADTFHELIKENNLDFTKSIINPKNWNQLWESNFHPVIVDDFVAVRAHFHQPIVNVRHEIVITPKMSFGTGHHATTKMMIKQMEGIDFKARKVFDFGTGTGILAILADKLGAASVTAIDNDEWSINNASENIQKNNCTNITLHLSDRPIINQTFDIILANITKNIILENLDILHGQMNKNGILLLSGLLEDDEKDIQEAAKKNLLRPALKLKEGNWLCLRFLR